jgi:phosphonopyruvate decarboxylase
MALTSLEACSVIAKHRDGNIVVTTMGAMNAMDALPPHPLTVACVPLMGGAACLGLGLALAQPTRKVFVLDGDASLLMELGGLVSVAQAMPGNYFHFIFNNSIQFAGLGNLPTPAQHKTNFVALAMAAGYAHAYSFSNKEMLAASLDEIFQKNAPAVIELKIAYEKPILGKQRPSIEMTDARFTRMGDELRCIRSTLGIPAET